ncbi:MAG: hypothetical protein EXX96DRAFT_537138 [Benjaminiella poitrasii]|nr:MAG: hypothetical protein EXX96DRAFT_537138 [Benjaminiella poitrasii]
MNNFHLHPMVHQFIPANQFSHLQSNLLLWTNSILSHYHLSVQDLHINSWKTGIQLLCILHYHQPSLVPSLQVQGNIEEIVLNYIPNSQSYHRYLSFIIFHTTTTDDNETYMLQYLLALITHLTVPTEDQSIQRQRDIESHLKSISAPSTSSSSSSDNEDTPSLYHSSLEDEETYSTTTTVTYSSTKKTTTTTTLKYYGYSSSSNSASSREYHLAERLNRLHHRLVLVTPTEIVHDDDYVRFEEQLNALHHEFTTLAVAATYNDNDNNNKDNQLTAAVADDNDCQVLYDTLKHDFDIRFQLLKKFARDLEFMRVVRKVQQELDWVTQKMIQSVRTYDDLVQLETHMTTSTGWMDQLVMLTGPLSQLIKLEALQHHYGRVVGWVDEVRVWFREAERIRSWIQQRIAELKTLESVQPFEERLTMAQSRMHADLAQQHKDLEALIEAFDQHDMGRLRAHVKMLTHGDLSPADATTIEITLSTLTTLDELTRLVRERRVALDVLGQRIKWETAYDRAVQWLTTTEKELEQFLTRAQWQPQQQQQANDEIIHTLLSLERSVTEFDLSLFTNTINGFQDLDALSRVELPDHLEKRQSDCEQRFQDLMKRMTYARGVVEQRLKLIEFANQAKCITEEGSLLLDQLKTHKTATLNEEQKMTSRVQQLQDCVLQLMACRIPYPEPTTNNKVQSYVLQQHQSLESLSVQLKTQLDLYCHRAQQQRQITDYLTDARRLCSWADQQLSQLDHWRPQIAHLDALDRLDQDLDQIHRALKEDNGKENEAIELLTSMQRLKDTRLVEVASQLETGFDRLELSLKECRDALETRRQVLEDSQRVAERLRRLRQFRTETKHQIPALKQRCGFMTGEWASQDKARLDALRAESEQMVREYRARQDEFESLKVDRFEWLQLGQELDCLLAFCEVVQEWFDRQVRLGEIEATLSDAEKLLVAVSSGEHQGRETFEDVEAALIGVGRSLDETDIMTNNKDDPLETANYSYARDRHCALVERTRKATEQVTKLKSDTDYALASAALLKQAEETLEKANALKREVNKRMMALEEGSFASQTAETIDALHKRTLASHLQSEQTLQSLTKQLPACDHLDLCAHIKQVLDETQMMLEREKRQAQIVRKIYIHAKAAQDIQAWIKPCSRAIAELPTDVCMHDEQELRDELELLDRKIVEMRPTIQTFEAMKARVFIVNGQPASLGHPGVVVEEAVNEREKAVLTAWRQLGEQLANSEKLLDHSKRGVEMVRKVKSILTLIGGLKDRLKTIKVCENDDVLGCPLTSIPNESCLTQIKSDLLMVQNDMTDRLEPAIEELDQMLTEKDAMVSQRTEISIAIRGLKELLKVKQDAVSEADKMQGFLTVMEEFEVLLLALTEAVSRASPQSNSSRADLQAMLIDLDTRYRYYEPKINELMEELKEVSRSFLKDTRVTNCLCQFYKRWAQLQQEIEAKKAELIGLIGPLAEITFDATLLERGRRALNLAKRVSVQQQQQQRPPSPKVMQSTPRFMTGRQTPISFATAARATAKRTVGGTVSPTARRVAARQAAAQQQRLRTSTRTPDAYVADPKNDLDVAVGHIVNDSPYKIQVKMVPGEVGKYWFGDVNPKLAYCRILRSRMVMVRVGGGWVELSEFLRDHALIEGDFVTTSSAAGAGGGVTQDGYLTTGRGSYHHHGDQEAAVLRESRSTPHHQHGLYGIKTGNKFLVTVDKNGKRVEVKMTKANSKDTKFITPRRINI